MIPLSEVFAMLTKCAPGFVANPHDHSWDIVWQQVRYPRLPLGRHGRARTTGRAEVERHHVKQMVRLFGIFDCAVREIPLLGQ